MRFRFSVNGVAVQYNDHAWIHKATLGCKYHFKKCGDKLLVENTCLTFKTAAGL